jgi:FkbM family methyltransferase
VLRDYLRRAPGCLMAGPWLAAALVRGRMRSGAACGVMHLPLDRNGSRLLSLDTNSQPEIDVFDEVVVRGIYPFDKLPFTPQLIADCGANIGYFSCLARVRFPEAGIYAWEPDRKNFARLEEQPILQSGRTTLTNAAVSDRKGRVSLSGAGHGCEVQGESTGSEGVECLDFAAWWREHSVPGSLLKMDIEGHETAVLPALRGSWKSPCAVFLETHAPRGEDGELVKQLEADGFRVELLRSHSLPGDGRVFKEYMALLS